MKHLEKLVSGLRRLPGIGPKQAERIALHLLRATEPESQSLIDALRRAREGIRTCPVCCNYCESEPCAICRDPSRQGGIVCVVEEPMDVAAIERARGYRGLYHVLHGVLSPLHGVGPDALRIRELLDRLRRPQGCIAEVILAMDLDTEGEATALYLGQLLKEFPVKLTRIAQGVPMGGDLDYVDEKTLSHAMSGRREL